jgi:hypothetical protein
MNLVGNRKFFISMVALFLSSMLSAVAIVYVPEQAVALIVAVGGNLTAITVPFVVGNVQNKRAEKINGGAN